jgi:organic hydroperoxide reductase OsmC/OhrA
MGSAGENHFTSRVVWTGNAGAGTESFHAYLRTWDIQVPGKPVVQCSNDPALGGDPGLMNPEDLLLSALAACHMLWFLHLASTAKITVTAYEDAPDGFGETTPDGAGRFTKVILNPRATVLPGTDVTQAAALHHDVHKYCYIARSMNFPIEIAPKFTVTA